MNEKSFEAKLKRVSAPAPDPEARLRAKRAALEEFARLHAANQVAEKTSSAPSKGFWDALRLFRDDSSHGSTTLAWFVRRKLFAGVAGACVVGLGIAMVWPVFSRYGDISLIAPAPPPVVDLEPQVKEDPIGPALSKAVEPKPAELARPEPSPKVPVASAAKPAPAAVAAPAQEKDDAFNEIVVTGSQQHLQLSLDTKREAVTVVDTISSEDIGKLSDQAVAESLQRANGAEVARAKSAPQPAETGNVSEVVVTGVRARAPITPHKGVAPSVVYQASRTVQAVTTPVAPPPTANMGVATAYEPAQPVADEGRDKFQQFDVNPVKQVADEPVSTFSADVDTASYTFVRRQLNSGRLTEKDSVRVEEMINYFDYAWPAAGSAKTPFKPTVVVSDSPWGKGRKLVHIGVKGYELSRDDAPGANLVLLLDVSGSMDSPDKLPLAVQSMELLLSSLKPTDTVGIVVYAGAAGTVLEPTPVKDKQ
jgi:Ca-activated chloride channel family protein